MSIATLLPVFAACKPRPESHATVLADGQTDRGNRDLKYLYHFGKYSDLAPYVTRGANGMTASDWSSIRSTSSQLSFRRGFYVARNPAYSDQYSLRYLFDPEETASPWMVRVSIRESCLQNPLVVTSVKGIDQNPAFAAWFATAQLPAKYRNYPPRAFIRSCQFPVDQIGLKVTGENDCTRALSDFYTANDIALVEDHWWPPELGYWLVRRRDCIESVEAAPNQVLEFASSPSLWRAFPDGQTKRGGNAEGAAAVVIQALARADKLVPATLAKLEASLAESDLDKIPTAMPLIIQAARLCDSAGRKVEFDVTVRDLFAAAKKIQAPNDAGRQLEFRRLLQEFAERRFPKAMSRCQQGGNAKVEEIGSWFLVTLDDDKIPASTARAAFLATAPNEWRCRAHRVRIKEVYCRPTGEETTETIRGILPVYVESVIGIESAPLGELTGS